MSPRLSRLRHGVPVYRFDPPPGLPPVSVLRFGEHQHPAGGRRHIHDFPLLLFAGEEVVVFGPGYVVDPTAEHVAGESVAVVFDPAAFDSVLLAPFRDVRRLPVPDSRAEFWQSTIAGIEEESSRSTFATVAYAILLLVELGRMIPDGDTPDPVVHAVLTDIEERYAGELSLRDVAGAVGLTPGYLTTVIRRRTGRTVQQWITEHRLVVARRLLADSSMPVSEVARRVGISDPAYFTRMFRREMGASPTAWRSGAQDETAV